MSAQYRPYRDEESVDGLETTSWTDAEPGSIQIYEKTTEELPFTSNKKALSIQIAMFTLTGILGFLLGYFGPFHQNELLTAFEDGTQVASRNSDLFEDPTIKDKLIAQIDAKHILQTLEAFKDYDRTPGSDDDHKLASYVANQLHEYGLEPVTVLNYTFKTMLPTKSSIIRILDRENNTIFSTTDKDKPDAFGPYLPLSQAEETIITTNQLLYLNKGLKDDYTKLPSMGLSVNDTEGKVFVIRQTYYQMHDIVINAQESGALAVLLFPDPDTFGSNSPFPESVQLPNDAARSHPLAWSNYGDLAALNISLTSGIDMTKLGLDKESKVNIPILLINYKTARTLLIGLSGAQVPSEWNCFDITLHLGPGYKENTADARSKIKIEFHNSERTLTTSAITGIIAGAVEPDRYVIMGSRRDSLNRGMLDSLSGTAVMLEIARVYGNLVKQGWRPRRSIIFNSFGAESLNLIGSSNWLETHQRLLHARAISYINCDLLVIGNKSVTIAASPLLYQVLYNATRQVRDPNDAHSNRTVYDSWRDAHQRDNIDEIVRDSSLHDVDKVVGKAKSDTEEELDVVSAKALILREYQKSASVHWRPKVKRLDLQSIYSPFFLYIGIPVVDVRYTGFQGINQKSNLLDDTLPLLGTQYDNIEALLRIDPHLKYHLASGQVLAEILRDLADSVYLPFNLLDYAVTLSDSYSNFKHHFGNTFKDSNLELENLERVIHQFTLAAANFHQRQDQSNLSDAMQVRKFNDQMMLLERAFLDPTGLPNYWERKHLILASHDGQDQKEGFPGLVDWITLLEGENLEGDDYAIFVEVLKLKYKVVVFTIREAIKIIDDVHNLK